MEGKKRLVSGVKSREGVVAAAEADLGSAGRLGWHVSVTGFGVGSGGGSGGPRNLESEAGKQRRKRQREAAEEGRRAGGGGVAVQHPPVRRSCVLIPPNASVLSGL